MKVPAFIEALIGAVKQELPRANVDVERVPGTNRYRLAVVAPQFARMRHPRRQNFMWDIAEKALKPQELLRVSMIIAMSPTEFRSLK
jgi:hypothetical protein